MTISSFIVRPLVLVDEFSRKSTKLKREAVGKKPSCLVRAVATPSGDTISSVIDGASCDLFQKRLNQVFKQSVFRSKSKKHRTGSQ